MKHYFKYFFLLLLLPSFFALTSCRKPIEKRIVGKWKRIIVEDVSSPFLEYWRFDEGGSMFIHKDTIEWNPKSGQTNDSCQYLVNARFRRDYIYLDITDKEAKTLDYAGVWEIIYLKKNTMMIVKRPGYESIFNLGHREVNTDRMGGVLFREFTKMQ